MAAVASSLAAPALMPGEVDVVIPEKPLPVERFAAQELTNFLSRVLGEPVPVVADTGKGRAAILLGRAAGLDVSNLERDAFRTKVELSPDGKSVVRIAGRDGRGDVFRNAWKFGLTVRDECATLFGVYAFLEDFAGVRFYFPGELGTVAKRRESVAVPVQDKTTAPWFTARSTIISRDGVWYEPLPSGWHQNAGKALCWLRHRFETARIPCCHGQNKFKIVEREGEGMDFPRARQFPLRHDGLDPSGVRVRDGRVLARATRNGYLASDAVCGRRRAL